MKVSASIVLIVQFGRFSAEVWLMIARISGATETSVCCGSQP
jgi:hypothetical protein